MYDDSLPAPPDVVATVQENEVGLRCKDCGWKESFGETAKVGALLRAETQHRKKCSKR